MCTWNYDKQVEKWNVQEVAVSGHTDKNPFVDYAIHGTFAGKHEKVTVDGFYDGDGKTVLGSSLPWCLSGTRRDVYE